MPAAAEAVNCWNISCDAGWNAGRCASGRFSCMAGGRARVEAIAGALARSPLAGGAAISLVNAALEGFVRAAALEAPRGIRLNVVSPGWVSETLVAMGKDGAAGTPAATVARSYVESVTGTMSGEVLEP